MECNLSNWKRGIRIGIGVGLLSVGLFAGLTGWQAAMADCLGAIAVFTGAAGFCPGMEHYYESSRGSSFG